MDLYDVIVIGSGGGMKVALPAAARGLRTALIEREDVAGTCLNRGCIPSKMLIYPSELPERIAAARRIQVEAEGPLRVDWPRLVRRINGTVSGMSAAQRAQLEQTEHLDLYADHARFVGERTLAVGDRTLRADRVFIATGSRPALPALPGLAETPFMTSREALRRTDLPDRLLVLGAGTIAVELGGAYAAAGAEVAFIVRSRFLRHEDAEIAAAFTEVFAARHEVHPGFQPERVDHRDGTFRLAGCGPGGRETTLAGDALLVATGVVPCTDDLGLEATGVAVDERGTIRVDDHLRTTCPGVYALGDCVGRYHYRHTVNHEGEYLVRSVLEGHDTGALDYGPVPHAVFSSPEIAGVGLTEAQARDQGHEVVVGRAAYAESNAGLARGYEHGLVKVLVDRPSRRLLGVHILGDEASNLIHLFIVAMKLGATLDALLDTIFIHPALPEVARDALRDARRRCVA